MTLRTLHACSAAFIALFALIHIGNHLAGLAGPETHIAYMEQARHLYRVPLVEGLLLACVAFQLLSGLRLALRGWRTRRGIVPWLQAGSGLYLAFFLTVHVAAVLAGRGLLHLDTNLYYAAAGLHVAPIQLFFAPYYFLALPALCLHLACALSWRLQGLARRRVLALLPAFGAIASLLILLSMTGALHPIEIPANYLATYASAPR
ncbi:hypothetical protein [Niveibacterium sp. SC-1]|uniref:hypothetical protein n=1 Tax=Niveibacterium sp. SC-1 TaxID=3135646 RepID=UPI00311EE5A7